MSHLIYNLKVTHEATGEKFTIKQVPSDKTAIQLLSSIASKLKLPPGVTGTLYHKITTEKLAPNETLSEAGIEDEDDLIAKFDEKGGDSFEDSLRSIEFPKNSEPRCPCVLLLDVSSSMAGESIRELNAGLITLKDALSKDSVASLRVELSIITFGDNAQVLHDFITADKFNPQTLFANGMTAMGSAINLALDKLEERKQRYKANGISYYRPWVFMITDGEPNDAWQLAADRVKKFEKEGKVAFFAVAVEKANMSRLAEIAVRQPVKLKEDKWKEMFHWLSVSLTSISHSNISDELPLQAPFGWANI